jgi:hypothetical protein
MRTGGQGADDSDDDDGLLLDSPTSKTNNYHHYPQLPSPAQTHDRMSRMSSRSSMMLPIQAVPAAHVLSPDDMLRAYAARAQSPTTTTTTAPYPNYDGNGMRTLYATGGANVMGGVGLSGKNRLSVSRFTEDDAYIGTAT